MTKHTIGSISAGTAFHKRAGSRFRWRSMEASRSGQAEGRRLARPATHESAEQCEATGPIPHHIVLESEYAHLHETLPDGYPLQSSDAAVRESAIFGAIHSCRHSALCLSGGGIRSAAFALGIIQGLAALKLMGAFDFVSTVSGGGYVGGWLSAWLYHAANEGGSPAAVFEALAALNPTATQPEPASIQQLRENSHYLTRKSGFLSIDVWTLVATTVRNLALNWLVILPLLASAVLVARLPFALINLGAQELLDRQSLSAFSQWLLLAGVGSLGLGLMSAALTAPSTGTRHRNSASVSVLFALMFVGTLLLTLYWAWSRQLEAEPISAWTTIIVAALVHVLIWVLVAIVSPRWWRPRTWISAAFSGSVAGFVLQWLANGPFADPLGHAELYSITAVPLMLTTLALSLGMASGEGSDDDREFWSRLAGVSLIAAIVWLFFSLIALIGPFFVGRFTLSVASMGNGPGTARVLWWLMTATSGAVAAWTSRGAMRAPLWRVVIVRLAMPTFVVLLLAGIAAMNLSLLGRLKHLHAPPDYLYPHGGCAFHPS